MSEQHRQSRPDYGHNRIARSQLTAEQVEPNNSINDILPQALDALIRRLPADWLEEEPADLFRLPLTDEGQKELYF